MEMKDIMELNHMDAAKRQGDNLVKVNKFLTVIRWGVEILTAMYILFTVWAVQPAWQEVDGFRRTFVDGFLEHFPFDDVQLTWIMMVVFGILIGVKVLLLKQGNFYKTKGKFFVDVFSMILWIVICIAWLVMVGLNVVGEVFYFFNFIPYEWIPFLNQLF